MTALSLPALLSKALVAFTIEYDNEFEHQMPHRTTNHGGADGPWLVSMVMWWNCMRFVQEEGVRADELERLARTKTNLAGMQRWGYVRVSEPDRLIRATPNGRKAQAIWGSLFHTIEDRWRLRFGTHELDQLRDLLRGVIVQIDHDLPDCLPILGYGLFSRPLDQPQQTTAASDESVSRLPLPALLSRVLLAFAIEYEALSRYSLAVDANVLRILDETRVRVRDLPALAGVSKEAIQVALGLLQNGGAVLVEADGRTKVVRLTSKGRNAKDAHQQLIDEVEGRWQSRFGNMIGKLSPVLERLAVNPGLRLGIEPYPDGWRASVRKAGTLPHYPMVLHRGGFPDGS